MLRPDLSRVRITTAAGAVINLERGGGLERPPQDNAAEHQPAHQLVWIPEELYQPIKDQPVKVEIDYLLTLLDTVGVHSMAALGGDLHNGGRRALQDRRQCGGNAVEWRCAEPGVAPACFSVYLENSHTRHRNPER